MFFWFVTSMFECFEDLMDYRSLLILAPSPLTCKQVPVSYISEAVYKTSVDWINQRSYEALGTFVIWSLESILADLAAQSGSKVSKKGGHVASSKSQVNIIFFCWLLTAIYLRTNCLGATSCSSFVKWFAVCQFLGH